MGVIRTVFFQLGALRRFATQREPGGDHVGTIFTDAAGVRALFVNFIAELRVLAELLQLWTEGWFASYDNTCLRTILAFAFASFGADTLALEILQFDDTRHARGGFAVRRATVHMYVALNRLSPKHHCEKR